MNIRQKNLIAWLLVLSYAALIFTLSSLPRPLPELVQKYFSDWILHGVEYGVFGLLLARALHLTLGKSSNFFLVGAVFLLAALYGVSDEWHQSFVPNRQFSAQDIVADGIGAFFGAWGWTVKLRYSRAKEKKVAGN